MIDVKRLGACLCAGVVAVGCMPYTAGRTAATVQREKLEYSLSSYVVAPGIEIDSVLNAPMFGADLEARYGLNDVSDLGLRVIGFTGALVSYKHQLQRGHPAVARIISAEVGAGLVGGADYGILQAMLITSTREVLPVAPYGGIRAFGTAPLAGQDTGLFAKQFTIGAFAGVRIRDRDRGFSVTPEVGVFYSPMPELRHGNFVVVPSISFSGLPPFPRRGWPIPVPRWTRRSVQNSQDTP